MSVVASSYRDTFHDIIFARKSLHVKKDFSSCFLYCVRLNPVSTHILRMQQEMGFFAQWLSEEYAVNILYVRILIRLAYLFPFVLAIDG